LIVKVLVDRTKCDFASSIHHIPYIDDYADWRESFKVGN